MLGSADFGSAVVIADLEAGIGTLTRLGDEDVDVVLVVVEPTPRSLEVGARAAALAQDKRAGRLIVVASRIRDDSDLASVRDVFGDAEIVVVPDDPAITGAEREGLAPLDVAPQAPAVRTLVELAQRLVPDGG